jgi:hypothetical protein
MGVPSFAAMIVASVVGWVIDDAVSGFPIAARAALALVVTPVVFYYVRGVLRRLRDGE